MAYANGKIPLSALTKMSTNLYARADAAASYERMAAAFNKVHGPMYMTDAYRSYELQEKIFRERYRAQATGNGPKNDVRRWNGVRYVRVNNAAAAVPGTSNHGLGVAVDFASGINTSFSSPQYRWMNQNAGYYGWDNKAGMTIREPWHWEYNPANDKSAKAQANTGAGSSTAKPTPAETKKKKVGEPMIYHAGGYPALGVYAHNGGFVQLKSQEEYNNLKKAGVPIVWLEKQTLDNLIFDARN